MPAFTITSHDGRTGHPRLAGTSPSSIRGWICACALALIGVLAGAAARGDTVALWLFDEPVGAAPGTVLNDAGPNPQLLLLEAGAAIVPGKFGGALRPLSRDSGNPVLESNSAATEAKADALPRRATYSPTTASRLNLGEGAWTIEGWFLLDADARDEGVILECGTGRRGTNDLVTRFSVLPRENAILFAGLAAVPEGPATTIARRVEFPNPEGPPSGVALIFSGSLVPARPLPRERWFHAALVHTTTGELILFVDGQHRATIAADLLPLPRDAESYLSIGRDGRGERPFPGAIDELRVSNHAVYTQAGATPGSFALPPGPAPDAPAAVAKPRPKLQAQQP